MNAEETLELNFLRYFYNRASDSMGPADGDIYDMIKREFSNTYGYLPERYMPELDEEELIDKAWELYCTETAGNMHVMDFWEELPEKVQAIYLEKAKHIV